MNAEELFCKLFPEYAVNGKPLSPYFDFFERGYEEAENKLKCCYNCKHSRTEYEHCRTNKHEKWEIKEK